MGRSAAGSAGISGGDVVRAGRPNILWASTLWRLFRSPVNQESASYTGHVNDSLGILEVFGLTPAMVALDQMDKTAGIRLHQTELNDWLGIVLKITGPQAAVKAAMAAGEETARQMNGRPVATILNKPDSRAMKALESPVETSPLIQQPIVKNPNYEILGKRENAPMADNASFALGFIETQGF